MARSMSQRLLFPHCPFHCSRSHISRFLSQNEAMHVRLRALFDRLIQGDARGPIAVLGATRLTVANRCIAAASAAARTSQRLVDEYRHVSVCVCVCVSVCVSVCVCAQEISLYFVKDTFKTVFVP